MCRKMLLKKVLPFSFISASLAMVACDSSSGTNESNDNNPAIPVDDPASSDSRNTASYDTLDSRYAIKYNVETVEDLPNCTESRDGNLAVVLDNDALYQCSAERWTKISLNPERSSSSGAVSSAAMSSVATPSSSSGKTPLTSSSSSESGNETAVSAHCFEPWNGNDGVIRIITGYDNGTETSGYWYTYYDDSDGGVSAIRWPVEMDPPYFDGIDPVIDHCGGVCGTYYLSKGTLTYDPYAGVAFNIAGIDDNGDPTTADASAMGGIRVTYTSDITMALELGLGEKMERNIGYDVPFVTLAKSSVATVKEFKWSQFKQAGWGEGKITGEEAAKILASIRFKMQGKDGMQGDFNIMAIEAYNATDCDTYNHQKSSSSIAAPKSSSSVMPRSSSSMRSSSSYVHRSSSSRDVSDKVVPCGEFVTWQGFEALYQVETGCNTEMENGGYWYDFDDYADGGRSRVIWPVDIGNEYDEFAMDPVIDYCSGVCGTIELNRGTMSFDPYAGVAFDFAGTDDKWRLVAADASDMEGVCIAYSTNLAASLEMSFGDKVDKEEFGYDIPFVTLAKSSSGTIKTFKWFQFKQAGWGTGKISGAEAAKRIASLRFKVQGKDGSSGDFNVMAVGPYNGSCNLNYFVGH